MKKIFSFTSPAAGLLLLAALSNAVLPRGAGAQEEIRLSGGEVAIYNLAGRAEIVSGGGSDVVVQVMRGGDDGRQLSMDVVRAHGRESLVVRYPDDQVVYPEMGRGSRTQMRIRSDGTFGGGVGRGGDQVEIRGSGSGLEAWADLRISVPNGTDLAVYLAAGDTEAQGLEGEFLIDTGSGSVSARDITGALSVDTGSGEVFVENVDGDLMVDTGSGGVEIIGIRGDEISVDTGSGSVRASRISASALVVDTGSGEVTLEAVSAPDIYVDTGSGQVEVDLLDDVEDLVVDTGSGSVTLRFPDGIGAEIEVDTGSGGIDVDIPLQVREVKRNYLLGVLGDGRGRIRIDTGSGGIRLLGR